MINATVRGNVGNVDLKYLQSGSAVLEFSLASNDRGKGKDGEKTETTTWIRCAVFGPRAESLSKHITKGDSILAIGPLSVREFESQGVKRFSVEMKVDQLDFCGGGGKGESGGGYTRGAGRGDAAEQRDQRAGAGAFPPPDDGDLPY